MTEQAMEQSPAEGSSLPAPEAPTPAADNTPAAESKAMEFGLHKMAESEDATDFIDEIRDQQAYKRGDPAANDPYRRQARQERIQRMVERAKEEAASVLETTGPSQEEIETRIQSERSRAKAEVRIEQYERENPGFREQVKETIAMYGDLSNEAASPILESHHGPEIIARICQNPETIEALNQLPPKELERFVFYMEGRLDADALSNRPVPKPPKTISTAPKPVPMVNGKAAPPAQKDLRSLISTDDDATAFIEESRRRARAKESLE